MRDSCCCSVSAARCRRAWCRRAWCRPAWCLCSRASHVFGLLSDALMCQPAHGRSAPPDAIGMSGWLHAAKASRPVVGCLLHAAGLGGTHARTHARAALGVGMAQAAATRKAQEVRSLWLSASRTHVTATGFTSTDRSFCRLSAVRCTLSAASIASAPYRLQHFFSRTLFRCTLC
jgi:hypothetical protein